MKITINLNKKEIEKYKSLRETYDSVGIVGLDSVDKKYHNNITEEVYKILKRRFGEELV